MMTPSESRVGICGTPGHGLSLILAFIGVKLVLHWAHGVWPGVPEIPTLLSLGVILGILAVVTATSLLSNRRSDDEPAVEPAGELEGEPSSMPQA